MSSVKLPSEDCCNGCPHFKRIGFIGECRAKVTDKFIPSVSELEYDMFIRPQICKINGIPEVNSK